MNKVILNIVPELEREMEMLGEQAVLNVFESAANLQYHPDTRVNKAIGGLLKKTNNFCTSMAIENEDLVTLNFILDILHKHAQIS